MSGKAIVLDANILIRAVLGKRVRELIVGRTATTNFYAPDAANAEARKYLPAPLEKRGVDSAVAMQVLDHLETIVRPIPVDFYQGMQPSALKRIAHRDADECRYWHVL